MSILWKPEADKQRYPRPTTLDPLASLYKPVPRRGAPVLFLAQLETMRLLVILCVVAAAAAAPRWPGGDYGALGDYVSPGHLFDTSRFWADLEATLMQQLLQDLSTHFPSDVSSEGVDGDSYKIVVPLEGFEERDIVVKARRGALMIQAVRGAAGGSTSYLNARTLPAGVDPAGRWGFRDGVLTLSFPLTSPEPASTAAAPRSREELDSSEEAEEQPGQRGETADMVGSLHTTASPNHVEDSTYSVDLKGDVEFVPVQVR